MAMNAKCSADEAVEALVALMREVLTARGAMGVTEALLLAPGLHRAGQFLDRVGCDKTELLAIDAVRYN